MQFVYSSKAAQNMLIEDLLHVVCIQLFVEAAISYLLRYMFMFSVGIYLNGKGYISETLFKL